MRKTKTYDGVIELLEKNRPSAMTGITPRDSDKELLIQYMQIHLGVELDARQLELIRTISFESITRCRRKLQEQGEYLGSPEIMAKRRIKGYELEQVTPSESAAGVQRRIEENV